MSDQADLAPDAVCGTSRAGIRCPRADYRCPSYCNGINIDAAKTLRSKRPCSRDRDPRGRPLHRARLPAAETKATANRPAAPRRPGGGLRRRAGVRRQGRVRHRGRRRGRRRVPARVDRIHAGPGRDRRGGRGARRRGDAVVQPRGAERNENDEGRGRSESHGAGSCVEIHRADAASETTAHRWLGRPKFDFQTGRRT